MSDDEKIKTIATFRFGMIADFVTGLRLSYGEREKLIQQKLSKSYSIPFSDRSAITRPTLERWISLYKKAGNRIDGLYPKPRSDDGKYRALSPTVRMAIKDIKNKKPKLKVPALIRELKHQKIIGMDEKVNLSNIYRFLKNENLLHINEEAVDRRHFEAESPNQIWQSDVMHGPSALIEGKAKKVYLMAIMDDHSRMIMHAEFYPAETIENFKNCLKKAIEARSLPMKLYVDNGSCFRAVNLEHIAASLGIIITHSRPYVPQGRGKIERWFRFVQDNFLPLYSHTQSLQQLNSLFENWVHEYHLREHGGTGEAPLERYRKNLHCVRPAPPDILNHFRQVEYRTVKKDRTVRLNSHVYEAPVALIDRQVELRFHPEKLAEIEIFFNSLSYGFANPVDPKVNSIIGRNWRHTKKPKQELDTIIPTPSPSNGELFSRGEK